MCGCIGYITIHFALLRGLDTTLQGFIMAEVMAFSDLKELGSEANVKAKRCRVDLSLANFSQVNSFALPMLNQLSENGIAKN